MAAAGVFCGGGGVLAVLVFAVLAFQVIYLNRAYPGVSVAGESVEGMTRSQIISAVDAQTRQQLNRPITIFAGSEVWTFTGQQLGLRVDVAATADRAFEVGRRGNILSDTLAHLGLLFSAKNIEPVLLHDTGPANQILQQLSNTINYPPQNARLAINPNGTVDITPAQSGRRLHVGATQPLILAAIFEDGDQQITAFTQEVLPNIDTNDVTPVVQQAQTLFSKPFIFSYSTGTDSGAWQLSPQQLAPMLSVVEYVDANGKEQLRLELDEQQLTPYFEEFAKVIDIESSEAKLAFNEELGKVEVVQHSRDGRVLDTAAATEMAVAAVATGSNQVQLPITLTPAKVSSDNLDALGINELVSESTSYFKGSSAGRMSNIALAASKFDGVIVPPGEIFSFNDNLGPVTKEQGFDESLIIYGNRTTVGIGGGVCQVSTTAFRTAFFGGFELIERWAHGYRVGWYETNSVVGLDATIYTPDVDLRFRNDTGHYLLIHTETDLDEGTVTFKFFGTPTNREVTVSEPIVENVVKPKPPVYERNPNLPPGQVKQVDWEKEGMDVTVTRVGKRGRYRTLRR